MKKNKIISFTSIVYNYAPEEQVIIDSSKIATIYYDQQGKITKTIRYGIPSLYQQTFIDYHTYKNNTAEVIKKDEEDNILGRIVYTRTDTTLLTEGYSIDGSLEWKRMESYTNNIDKKPKLIIWYDNDGNMTDKQIYKYDEIGLLKVERYQYDELRNSEIRINNDKYKLEFQGEDPQGILYKNITIYDKENRLTETYFENFINDFFSHQKIIYGEDGLRKEEITYNKSGEVERLIKYEYEK